MGRHIVFTNQSLTTAGHHALATTSLFFSIALFGCKPGKVAGTQTTAASEAPAKGTLLRTNSTAETGSDATELTVAVSRTSLADEKTNDSTAARSTTTVAAAPPTRGLSACKPNGTCAKGYSCVQGLCAPPPAEPPLPRMVRVPAGDFEHGEGDLDPYFANEGTLFLNTFDIDIYEVTLADYLACIRAGKCSGSERDVKRAEFAEPSHRATGYEEPNEKAPQFKKLELNCSWAAENRDNVPVTCVTWDNARQYCAAQSKRLPTEAEWEKAARGETSPRPRKIGHNDDWNPRPFGAFNCERTPNDGCDFGAFIQFEQDDTEKTTGTPGCNLKSLWPVGSKPKGASPYGALDMYGNAAEWVEDAFRSPAYPEQVRANLPAATEGIGHVVRGGSFVRMMSDVCVRAIGGLSYDLKLFKNIDSPLCNKDKNCATLYHPEEIGFRCARTPNFDLDGSGSPER